MRIAPFKVEQWMNAWETRCAFNLAETCVASVTVEELLLLAGRNGTDLSELLPLRMTYGEIEGSDRLRDAIAALYEGVARDAITVTHGTIGANMLVHKAVVGRGDHVISIVPTYQQHHSIPESIGAEVDLLHLRAEDGFRPDPERLRAMLRPDTRLIALTNPNNPTGALIGPDGLAEIAGIARASGAFVLCDEVYRGTGQTGDGMGPSIVDLYEKGIATAGLSKAYALAGLRVGWVVAPPEVTEAVRIHRDYDTISVGRIDDHLAAVALEAKDAMLARSRRITRGNLALLSDWVDATPRVSWVRPQAGTTAMLKIEGIASSRDFCIGLLEATGVMLTPGDCFDMEGHVRIGYANAPEILRDGLERFGAYLAS